MKWLNFFKKKPTVNEELIQKCININNSLLDALNALKTDYENKKAAMLRLNFAILLKYGGTITINKNFIDAVHSNNLQLEVIPKDNGDLEVVLMQPGEKE